MRLPHLSDAARAITRWRPLPPCCPQKILQVAVALTQAVEEVDRQQITLFPECLEDWICEDNPVRVIDVFVGGLDLPELHFGLVDPEVTRRPHALQQKGTAFHGFA